MSRHPNPKSSEVRLKLYCTPRSFLWCGDHFTVLLMMQERTKFLTFPVFTRIWVRFDSKGLVYIKHLPSCTTNLDRTPRLQCRLNGGSYTTMSYLDSIDHGDDTNYNIHYSCYWNNHILFAYERPSGTGSRGTCTYWRLNLSRWSWLSMKGELGYIMYKRKDKHNVPNPRLYNTLKISRRVSTL